MKISMMTLLLGSALLAGAAPAQTPQRVPATITSDSFANGVTVQNDRKVPVTVYMDYGDFDRRLGVVAPYAIATLPLPGWAVRGHESIRLFAHPEGEVEDLASEWFSLAPPARLGMIVPPWGKTYAAASEPCVPMTAVIPPEELADATLTVENPRAVMVTVFAEQGAFDVRLGQVPAHGTATLRFPRSVVGPDETVRIFVHPDGALDLASEPLDVSRGEHLGLRVPAH